MATNEFLIGKRERMAWIAETSYASGGTMSSGEVVGLNVDIQADWGRAFQETLSSGADSRTIEGQIVGGKYYPYTMNFVPVNWRWLKYLMSVVDADDSGTKTHTFTIANTINTYKLEWAKRHTTNHVLTCTGNFVKRGVMSFRKATSAGNEGFIKVALDCVCQDNAQGTSVTSLSNLSDDPFQYRAIKLTIDGNEITEVNSGELVVDGGINENDSRYCNTTLDELQGEPIPGTFKIRLRANVNISDKTYHTLFAAGTAISGTVSLLVDRDATGNDQMLFTFSNVYVHKGIANTNMAGVTNVDLILVANTFTSVVARDAVTTY